jgi:hypothetical protein
MMEAPFRSEMSVDSEGANAAFYAVKIALGLRNNAFWCESSDKKPTG